VRALKKQADGMKAAYDQLEKDAKEPKKLSDDNEKLKSELDKLRGEHEKLKSELERTKKEKAAEVEAIKKQASTSHATATRAQPCDRHACTAMRPPRVHSHRPRVLADRS
jgi:SMC interacting uncharacterized protein involved in chromosome segregation